MIEEIDFETYLHISKDKFQIFLFDKKNLKNLYKEELKLQEKFDFLDLINLSKFLDDNIFKIEKLAGNFIKNIFLVIESDENLHVNIAVKKKNYGNYINKKYLENTLIEVKDLFKESHQKQTIMHMVIINYILNGEKYSSLPTNLSSKDLCLEINFVSITNNLTFIFDKLLEKYQIKVSRYLCGNYIKEFFKENNSELSVTLHKLKNGLNQNEVILVPKNIENKGFFEKFFQLFG